MMAYDNGPTLGQKLCEAMGLPADRVQRITIDCAADCLAIASVIMKDTDGERIIPIVKQYRLVEEGATEGMGPGGLIPRPESARERG